MQTDIEPTLIWLASMLASPDAKTEPVKLAKQRGWLSAKGRPTSEGLSVFRAVEDQSQTRSVFRAL
jgi:hypothetical protein